MLRGVLFYSNALSGKKNFCFVKISEVSIHFKIDQRSSFLRMKSRHSRYIDEVVFFSFLSAGIGVSLISIFLGGLQEAHEKVSVKDLIN